MANPLYFPEFRAFDSNGDPLSGGKVYTYSAGTLTPKATYTTSALAIENANPVILDDEGYPTSGGIWLDGPYKIIITDANDVQQGDTIDNFQNDSGDMGPSWTFQMATAGGTVDAITASYSPVLTLTNLVTCGIVALGANTSATPTFSPDGLSAHTITKRGGLALKPGDIPAANAVSILEYNSPNTRWELLNPQSYLLGAEQTIASATTTNLGTLATSVALITGTTTITALGSSASTDFPIYFVRFSGILTLTHDGTGLILPGSANITTANGDTAIFQYLGSSNWKCLSYTKISGAPVLNPSATTSVSGIVELLTQAEYNAATDTTRVPTANLNRIVLGTVVASTSGTSIDFTSIPAGTRRIKVMLYGVSTNGTANPLIQIGDSGGIETSGYLGASQNVGLGVNSTAGFIIASASAASVLHGSVTIDLFEAATFKWIASGAVGQSNTTIASAVGGSKTLSAELDRVRITTSNGTDAFDAGEVNISYER